MAGEITHPGSWVGDSVEEFKKLPMWGKIAVGAAFVGVAGLGFYEYKKGQSNASVGTSLANGMDQNGANAVPGSQSPFPMINGQPLLPSGTNPVFGPGGDVVGYQQPPPPAAPTPPTPGPGLPTISNWIGNIPNFSKVWQGGSDASGQRFWFIPPGGAGQQTLFYLPVGSKVYAGGDGRWWYKTPGGQQQALTNNGKFAQPASTTQPMVMSNTMSNPTLAPAQPKVS